jgi:hypothetical protein
LKKKKKLKQKKNLILYKKNMEIFKNIEQGTEEWLKARA